jgi:hypothetical protein
MSVTLGCTSAPFVRCGENWNYFLTMATAVVRNAKEAMVAPMVGSGGVCVWRESGVRRSVLCCAFGKESGFSRREDVFTFNLIKKDILLILYFQCDLQRRYCSLYCSTQKRFISVNFDGSYFVSLYYYIYRQLLTHVFKYYRLHNLRGIRRHKTRVTTRPAFRGTVPKTYVKYRAPHFAWNVPQISFFIIYSTILNFRI